jgi:hypothetical protein
VLSILANVAVAEEFDRAAELKKMEGRFERFFQNMAGTTFRVVKEVAGDQSTVTTYDDVGNVIEAHNSTIKVEKRGPVRVLSFFNVLVTAGPNKGHTQLATSSYIYRIDGDSITECWGLLEEDTSPVRAFQWRRIKDEQK